MDNACSMQLCFSDEYAVKTDGELVRLWADRESLVPEALDALTAEIYKRQLDVQRVATVIATIEERVERRERRRELNRIPVGIQPAGLGRIGRLNYEFDNATGHETFDTIVFAFFLWFPLFPQAAYRIQNSRSADLRWRMLAEIPIPWRAVLVIWARSALAAAFIFFVFVEFVSKILP